MEISKKSWHSRLYRKIYTEQLPKSFCMYFWSIVFALCITLLMVSTIIFVLVGMVIIWFPGRHEGADEAGGIGYAILLLILIFWVIDFFEPYFKKRRRIKQQREWDIEDGKIKPQPNILVEYLKAVKNKACPRITWKD